MISIPLHLARQLALYISLFDEGPQGYAPAHAELTTWAHSIMDAWTDELGRALTREDLSADDREA